MICAGLVDKGANAADIWNRPSAWMPSSGAVVQTTAGEPVSPETALTVPTWYAALRAISEDIAKLPVRVFERDGDKRNMREDHEAWQLLNRRPNPWMGALTFRETLTHHALGWGGGFAEIGSDSEGNKALYIIHPSRVKIEDAGNRGVEYHIYSDDAGIRREVILESRDVLHVRGLGGDGIRGYSVARIMAESIGSALAKQHFQSAYFGNGAHSHMALIHPDELDPEAATRMRQSWQSAHSGARQAFKLVVLEEGVDIKNLGVNPEDAQAVESGHFSIEELCRALRISPVMLQHLVRATFSNIEELYRNYVSDTLSAWFVRWEQELDDKLFSKSEQATFRTKHDTKAFLAAKIGERVQAQQQWFRMGVLSVNEIRALEELNPVGPEGDKRYITADLIPLEDAANPPEEPEDTEPEETDEPDPNQNGNGNVPPMPNPRGVRSACRTLLIRAVSAELQREKKACAAKAKKPAEEFASWTDDFYNQQRARVVEAVRPVLSNVLSIAGVPDSTVNSVAENYADVHVRKSREQVRVAYADEHVAETCNGWLKDRPADAAEWMIERCVEIA